MSTNFIGGYYWGLICSCSSLPWSWELAHRASSHRGAPPSTGNHSCHDPQGSGVHASATAVTHRQGSGAQLCLMGSHDPGWGADGTYSSVSGRVSGSWLPVRQGGTITWIMLCGRGNGMWDNKIPVKLNYQCLASYSNREAWIRGSLMLWKVILQNRIVGFHVPDPVFSTSGMLTSRIQSSLSQRSWDYLNRFWMVLIFFFWIFFFFFEPGN